MTIEQRPTKAVASRIDSSYHKEPSPMRTLRRALVIVCALGAAAWGGWALVGKRQRVYNPGPVTAAHAMFENNCDVCHDGGSGSGSGSGFFAKGVSDAACLNCHDGAVHAARQVSLVSMNGGKPAMSSHCTTCHVEHKGGGALVGVSDALCTRCHENLTANVLDGRTDLPATVTAFNAPPAHPAFGRLLKPGGGGAWVDPTPLKFNHKKHLSGINPPVGDCTSCHAMSPSGERRIMRPVSYEANCKSCHPLTLGPGLPEVPHERMEIVRLFTGNVPVVLAQRLAMMPPAEKEKALTVTSERRQGLRVIKETKKLTDAEWLDAQMKDLVEKKVAASPVSNLPAYKAIESLESPARIAAALELYAAYGMSTSCSYCHAVEGSPAGAAKSEADLLHTKPTGFELPRSAPTTSPSAARPTTRPLTTPEGRRWFADSVFRHDAHRSMACVDCHGQAKTSTLTSDVLLPDVQSCIACHHAGGRGQAAASSNCITCHVYHDRGREQGGGKGRSVREMLGEAK